MTGRLKAVRSGLPIAAFAAAGVFLFLLLRPAYISVLRRRMQAADPAAWAQLPTTGRVALLLPSDIATRYHDEACFAARVQQILLHGAPFNPYWREDRQTITMLHDCVSAYLVAAVAFLCRGDLNRTWVVAVALIGALWFLLFYALFKEWCGRDDVAVPLALFSILFPDLYVWLLDVNFNVHVTWVRFYSVFFQDRSFIRPQFYRLPSLFLSYLLLVALFRWTWLLASQKRLRPFAAAALGLGYGLMTFVHPFESVFGMASVTIFLLAVWLLAAPRETRLNLLTVVLAGLVVPGVYAFVMWVATDPRVRMDTLEMDGMVRSRHFYLITAVHALFAGFGLFQRSRESDETRRQTWLFLACSQAAAFACRNTQVLTGTMLLPFHYITLGSFTGCLMLFLWGSRALSGRSWWTARAGAAACAVILAWGAFNEKKAAENTYQLFGLPADAEAALDWTRGHLPMDALVLSLSMETNEEIVLYTQAHAQVPPASPPASGFFSKDQYLRKVAEELVTCRVDVDRFLAERWLDLKDKLPLLAEISRDAVERQRVNLRLYEPAEWFYPYVYADMTGTSEAQGRARLRELVAQTPPLSGPFYLWVNAQDEHLLKAPPESFGGALVYRNATVRIYEFDHADRRG
jgi:hypothetical protein